jgi:hypothetical protein
MDGLVPRFGVAIGFAVLTALMAVEGTAVPEIRRKAVRPALVAAIRRRRRRADHPALMSA